MKVIEHIENAQNPIFSFEIIPPKRGTSVQEITDIVKDLKVFNPPYIDVTSHSAEAYYEEGKGWAPPSVPKHAHLSLEIWGNFVDDWENQLDKLFEHYKKIFYELSDRPNI